MEVITFDLKNPPVINQSITACIGYFDGLHVGHQQLIQHVLQIARNSHSTPALITFEPDPWVVIKHIKDDIPHLTPMKHRMEIAQQLGIELWVILKFEEDMAHLPYTSFHELVLKPLHLHTLVCGYDFHYANRGEGDIHTLQEQSLFQVDVVPEVSEEHKKISSTCIEELILKGDVSQAAHFLNRFYELRGVIKSGSRVGGSNGYPTANLDVMDTYVIPYEGVYVGSVFVKDKWHCAIINIGHNPTYNFQKEQSIEAHILHFHDNIYHMPVRFRFHEYIRGEKKFANIEELSKQLALDEQQAELYFKNKEELLICD